MTGLPFVYAFWAGRPGAIGPEDVAALHAARERGWPQPLQLDGRRIRMTLEKAARADRYLREDVKYALGERELAGLTRFYELAVEVGLPGLNGKTRPTFY